MWTGNHWPTPMWTDYPYHPGKVVCTPFCIKAMLQDMTSDDKFYLSLLFLIVKLWNYLGYDHICILSPQYVHGGCFAENGNVVNTAFPMQYYSTRFMGIPVKENNCWFCVITANSLYFLNRLSTPNVLCKHELICLNIIILWFICKQ